MLVRFSLLVALALSGCGFLTDAPGPPTTAVMTRVSFDSAPLLKPDGGRWDGGLSPSGPDLVLVLRRPDGSTRFSNRDLLASSGGLSTDEAPFPLVYVTGPSGGIRIDEGELGVPLTAELRDADFGGSELLAELGSLVLASSRPQTAGATTVTSLRSDDGRAVVRVFWTWEE